MMRGYTLVEVLVVLFIISIVTSVAIISIGRNDTRQIESFADEMVQLLTLAEEQAMLESTVLGVSFAEHSFEFLNLQPFNGDKKKHWQLLSDNILSKQRIPKKIDVSIKAERKRLSTTDPQIMLSTSGEITPFAIYIGKSGERPRYLITGSADGEIIKQRVNSD